MRVLLYKGLSSDFGVAQFVSLMHGSMLKSQSFFPTSLAIAFRASTAQTNQICEYFFFGLFVFFLCKENDIHCSHNKGDFIQNV